MWRLWDLGLPLNALILPLIGISLAKPGIFGYFENEVLDISKGMVSTGQREAVARGVLRLRAAVASGAELGLVSTSTCLNG